MPLYSTQTLSYLLVLAGANVGVILVDLSIPSFGQFHLSCCLCPESLSDRGLERDLVSLV